MKLYLIRHGAAAWTSPDFERCLSPQGKSESIKLFEKHQTEWHEVTHFLVSPYPRAQQSADLLSSFLPSDTCAETYEHLQPESSIARLLSGLSEQNFTENSNIVLVAHNPLLSKLVNKLLGKPQGFYQLGTSAIAALELDAIAPGCAELRWIEAGF